MVLVYATQVLDLNCSLINPVSLFMIPFSSAARLLVERSIHGAERTLHSVVFPVVVYHCDVLVGCFRSCRTFYLLK